MAIGYQEYPRHLHKPGGAYLVVENDEARDRALEAGWSLWPVQASEEPSEPAAMSTTTEAAAPVPRKRRGRPPKGEGR